MKTYSCPRCSAALEYRVNFWTPWQANPLFRCPHCSALLQRVHSSRSLWLKFSVFLVFLVTEIVAMKRELPAVWGTATFSEVRWTALRLLAILVVYVMIMRLVTWYRSALRRDDSPL